MRHIMTIMTTKVNIVATIASVFQLTGFLLRLRRRLAWVVFVFIAPISKYDVTVAQALYDLDCNRTYLENTVDTYNMMSQ